MGKGAKRTEHEKIGKPHGLADRKAALGRIPKGKTVKFVDELTLVGYEADGAVVENTRSTGGGNGVVFREFCLGM